VGELGRSNVNLDLDLDLDPGWGWGSVLHLRHLKLRLRLPHRSLSPRRLRIRGRAGESGWCLRLLSDKMESAGS
jgi:hypothetical protein